MHFTICSSSLPACPELEVIYVGFKFPWKYWSFSQPSCFQVSLSPASSVPGILVHLFLAPAVISCSGRKWAIYLLLNTYESTTYEGASAFGKLLFRQNKAKSLSLSFREPLHRWKHRAAFFWNKPILFPMVLTTCTRNADCHLQDCYRIEEWRIVVTR